MTRVNTAPKPSQATNYLTINPHTINVTHPLYDPTVLYPEEEAVLSSYSGHLIELGADRPQDTVPGIIYPNMLTGHFTPTDHLPSPALTTIPALNSEQYRVE